VSPLLEELPPEDTLQNDAEPKEKDDVLEEETQEIDCGADDDQEGAPEIAWPATPETQEIDCGVSNDDEEGAPEIAWSATPESTPPQSPRLSCGQQQIVWMPMWLPVYPLQVY